MKMYPLFAMEKVEFIVMITQTFLEGKARIDLSMPEALSNLWPTTMFDSELFGPQ